MAAYHTLIYLNYAWNYYSEIYVSDIYTDLLHLQEKKNFYSMKYVLKDLEKGQNKPAA